MDLLEIGLRHDDYVELKGPAANRWQAVEVPRISTALC